MDSEAVDKTNIIRIAAYSNKGRKRETNEDAVVVSGCVLSGIDMENPITLELESERDIFCVIDGMGGYKGGRLAAQIIAQNIQRARLDLPGTMRENDPWFADCIKKTAEEMRNISQKSPELDKMGATMAGLYFCNEYAYAFNCGDSRVYRFCDGYMDKLTRDHSIVQELVDNRIIKEEEMRAHPKKNVVTSSINPSSDYDFYFRKVALRKNDIFFICSDGVWETFPLEEIEKTLSNINSFDGCSELAKNLLEAQCKDNVSFILISFLKQA